MAITEAREENAVGLEPVTFEQRWRDRLHPWNSRLHINPDGEMVRVPMDMYIGTGSTIGWDVRFADGDVIIGSGVTIGAGSVVRSGAIIGDLVSIGNYTDIQERVVVEHEVVVGHGCVVRSGAKLMLAAQIEDAAHVGPCATVGIKAIIREKVRLPAWEWVGDSKVVV